MNTTTTQGVTVTVTTNYLPDYSSPGQEHYVFAYKIDIRNNGEYTVKLLRRHWYIYDANGVTREVEGEGVVGQQPTLEPGDSHQYVSGCNLKSGLGKMRGTYQMERLVDGKEFTVDIPEFTLVVPYRLN
ncbi:MULTISPECIES: Co2+/Mg2+ efflux protein ApaG [Hymenobacter]|uniref:Protein ApaG n=1 Tax=Hymenobacter jejuensis TaxID=2502781 RepID=A0A5B8A3H4_9BACT|nr:MULTISPECIES: Co2+/Mg2+ efflux protein ApaG [Hymenobacter]MBC6990409.1 Co2+/Mg2+ efflux protein ApaG [Hymenobacter sp. BT491]QDA61163.1 Co2+/Mg2+ efflux protein ApaG [Hymenobacter jejuensis]